MKNIDNKKFWENYNKELIKLSDELISYNQKNIFNYLEDNHYNHIRDLIALSILKNKSTNESKIKVLDYGSNSVAWSNMSNKIDLKKIDLTIFDPFSDDNYEMELGKDLIAKIINEIDIKRSLKFDITIFGSSSQYINDFYEKILNFDSVLSKLILFTHTPFSLEGEFISNQYSGFKGKKIVRSFNEIKKIFSRKGYEIIFKSTLPSESTSVDKNRLAKTVHANILFEHQDF